MSTFNEKNWRSDERLVALRVGAQSLPGVLKKHLRVPHLSRALVTMPNKKVILTGGKQVTGLAEAVLVKTRKFDLRFDNGGLVTSEGYLGECTLVLAFMAAETDFDLEQVAENLLKGRQEVSVEDVHTFLSEAVEEVLKTFVSGRAADEICQKPVVEDIQESLAQGLKKLLYLGGLTFCGVTRLDYHCPEYEQLQSERSKIKEREEVIRSRVKLDELELQGELARIQALKEVGVDPNVALEIELGKVKLKGSRSKLLLVACGKEVCAFDPCSSEPTRPQEVYLLPKEMGYARSVRIVRRGGEALIALGAQRGVYLVSVEGGYSGEFYLKARGRPRGGFNSAALAGDTIYASHSEFGLVRWDGEGVGDSVLREVTDPNRYTRGVCVHEGTGYFSSGATVYAFDPVSCEVKASYAGRRAPITALFVAGDSIFAGNQEGEVLHWATGDPGRPARVLLRRQGTIYSVGKMRTERGRFLLIGARDYSVSAFDPVTGASRQYLSPDLLRWVDGAGDFVFASSYSGHRVFVWDVDRPSRHTYSIPIDERSEDIYVWEEDRK